MWYRVFGRSAAEVPPAELAAHLHAAGHPVEPHFKGDDLGWTSGELRLGGKSIVLERYLTEQDDIREDLNAHAAELETMASPHSTALMTHVIQTQQLITCRGENEPLAIATCRFLASKADGVYQIDGQGWFAANGDLLIQERA